MNGRIDEFSHDDGDCAAIYSSCKCPLRHRAPAGDKSTISRKTDVNRIVDDRSAGSPTEIRGTGLKPRNQACSVQVSALVDWRATNSIERVHSPFSTVMLRLLIAALRLLRRDPQQSLSCWRSCDGRPACTSPVWLHRTGRCIATPFSSCISTMVLSMY